MTMLTQDYQYLGRSNAVSCPAGWNYYILLYGKTQADTASHTYRVTLRQRLVCNVESSFYRYATSGGITVDGQSAAGWEWALVPDAAWNTTALTEDGHTYKRWTDIAEGTVLVDGDYGREKAVTVRGWWVMESQSDSSWFPYTGQQAVVEAAVTLPSIAGASTPSFSAGAVDMGQAVTVYTNRLSDSFTCRLTYSFEGITGTIGEDVTDEAPWIPSLELARQIPNSDRATAVITCHTYQNGQLIGARDNYLTLRVPEDICPTVSAAWQDTTGAYGMFGTLVQNASALEIDITASGAYGSTVQTSAVTLDGKAYTGQTLLEHGTLPLAVTVTDSRERSATALYALTVAEYSLPTLTLTAHRCTEDGTADDMGEYAQVTVEGSVTDLSGLNAFLVTIEWRGGKKEIAQLPAAIMIPAPSVSTMPITARLEDRLYSVSRDMVLSTGYATLDFLAGGKGISMGKTATREGFDCAMPAYFTAGLNGAHLQTCYVDGTATMGLQTKYTDFSGPGDNRQSIFLFGTVNFMPVHGLLQVNNGGSVSWSGTGSVTATALEEGKVELTLPTNAWDWFAALSAEPFHFL